MSEAQKYQGALYRPEKEKKGKQNKQNPNNPRPVVPQQAYVEDASEGNSPSMIEALTPTAVGEAVNVFDFLDPSTPGASRIELPLPEPMSIIEDDAPVSHTSRAQSPAHAITGQELVRVTFDDDAQSITDLVEYGTGPVNEDAFVTPAPKREREGRERKKDKKDRDERKDKKDKKRKRLHVETHDLETRADEIMTDAPPVLHSGLTGGLGKLLSRQAFPPSPDLSGDAAETSPGIPAHKTKPAKTSKRGRVDTISQGFLSYLSGNRAANRDDSDEHKRKHRRHRERSKQPSPKMLEYKSTAGGAADGSTVIVFNKPRADLLLSFVGKGPTSERGVSMNKALKRYHRERTDLGIGLAKRDEEKELWKNLRMRKNDRGEIVLFML